MLKDPSNKYRQFAPIDLPDRKWPTRQLTTVPVWCSTDLRDGNQALFEPMSRETKKRLFKTLCAVGLKEIEVGFPSASDTDFQTVRDLIERARRGPRDGANSMLADRRDGKPMEYDARNGVIVRLGRKHGIAAPMNALMVSLLEAAQQT